MNTRTEVRSSSSSSPAGTSCTCMPNDSFRSGCTSALWALSAGSALVSVFVVPLKRYGRGGYAKARPGVIGCITVISSSSTRCIGTGFLVLPVLPNGTLESAW